MAIGQAKGKRQQTAREWWSGSPSRKRMPPSQNFFKLLRHGILNALASSLQGVTDIEKTNTPYIQERWGTE